jgi:sulfatase modifying factor 1
VTNGRILLALAMALSCDTTLPPTGQVLLYFDTDAPLPPAAGSLPAPGDATPLFDTMIVDVLPPGSSAPCSGCSHEFAIDKQRFGAMQASIGIPAPAGVAGYQVRVRMFLARWKVSCAVIGTCVDGGVAELVPHPGATVDVTITLPATPAEGVLEKTLVLRTANVGQPLTVTDGSDYFDGAPAASLVGSWAPALPVPCSGAARQGEACIPGGAYWMGSFLLREVGTIIVGGNDAGSWPHLVVVSPFYLKTTETLVSELRAANMHADAIAGQAPFGTACAFTATPATHELSPVNCVTRFTARAFCKQWGGQLPTDAQLEYAAGGLVGGLFVWGNDPPQCGDAVWGHPGIVQGQTAAVAPCNPALDAPPAIDDPQNPRARDRLDPGDGNIVTDLNGSLDEWTFDTWQDDDPTSSCWGTPGPLQDPVCALPGSQGTIHGGSYLEQAEPAAYRREWDTPNVSVLVGFRCARSGQ